MSLNMMLYKDLPEDHKQRVKKEWESDPMNYDEEIDDEQLILTDLKI